MTGLWAIEIQCNVVGPAGFDSSAWTSYISGFEKFGTGSLQNQVSKPQQNSSQNSGILNCVSVRGYILNRQPFCFLQKMVSCVSQKCTPHKIYTELYYTLVGGDSLSASRGYFETAFEMMKIPIGLYRVHWIMRQVYQEDRSPSHLCLSTYYTD